jgi:hypothetical protein
MIIATKTAESLRLLGMTQLCLSRLARVSNVRLSRFLGGSLELRPDEMDRLAATLHNCFMIQKGDGRLASSNLPIDWDRMVISDESTVGDASFEFEGDFDFCLDRHPVLSVLIPLDTLKSLVSAGPSRFLKITQSEVVTLLGLVVRNPNTSEDNRVAAENLLELSNQGAGDDDR